MEAQSLPKTAVEAFRQGSFEIMKPLIMTVEHYLAVGRALDPGMYEQRRLELAQEAATRAFTTTHRSFVNIWNAIEDSPVSWGKLEIQSVQGRFRDKDGGHWIEYSESHGPIRIDAHIELGSSDHRLSLKIDDCFLVDSRRYVGGGFRVK